MLLDHDVGAALRDLRNVVVTVGVVVVYSANFLATAVVSVTHATLVCKT